MSRPAAQTRAPAAERWLFVVAWAVLAGGGLLLVGGLERFVPPCAFREATGAYCPGCGSGRALVALARLDLAASLRANVLAVTALPVVLGALVAETAVAWGLATPSSRRARWLPWAALAVVAAFWILRNVPAWPLTLLAPR